MDAEMHVQGDVCITAYRDACVEGSVESEGLWNGVHGCVCSGAQCTHAVGHGDR